MNEKKRMSKKAFTSLWGAVLALLLIATLVGNFFAAKYATIITRSLGHTTSKIVTTGEAGNSEYFSSDYESQEALLEHQRQVCLQLEAEGSVLLKNEGALPLSEGSKVTLLGLGSTKFLYGGNGSGAIDSSKAKTLKAAMETEGFAVNEEVWKMYEASDAKIGKGDVLPETYSEQVKASMQEYSDAALVVISRMGHEANDIAEKLLALNEDELAVVKYANENFDKVIVVLNTANPIELGWLNFFQNIKGCLWVGYPGQEGILSIPQILLGRQNPSGRLVDTYAFDSLSSPAAQIYGSGTIENFTNDTGAKKYYTVYGENIYVGYRYYETRYEDVVLGQGNASSSAGLANDKPWSYSAQVQFPFGYGLSYTSFDYSDFSMTEEGEDFVLNVTVTNQGQVAGQDVVEAYFQSPYTDYDRENRIEKSAVELCGFAKTQTLAPGESQSLSIRVPKETLRTYDAYGAGTYVVDAGTYYLALGRDCHDGLNNILAAKGYGVEQGMTAQGNAALVGTYEQAQLDTTTYALDQVTGNEIVNQFDKGSLSYYDPEYTYLSRSDWEATWPAFYGTPNEKGKYFITASEELLHDSQDDLYEETEGDEMPVTGSGENINLITMRGKDYDDEGWEAILDCLTPEEMYEMVRLGGWQTMQIESISKPMSSDQDGPAGISGELIMSNVDTMGYPSQILMASSWNPSLAEEMGRCVGEDGLMVDVQGWYAPGAGTHRHPIGGRNFEYYSEDGFLAGSICAAEVAGAQSKGMYCYLKHLVLNDQEDHRYGINTFATEQSIREIYLKPFEMAVKQADCRGMMAAFNGIGGIWCGANEGLLKGVLEKEWGFHGIVVTDYATANEGYMYPDMGLQAGCDLWLNTDSQCYVMKNPGESATFVKALRSAAHDILYTVVNSSAMNGIDENVQVVKIMPLWQKWLIAFDVAMALILLGGVLLIHRRNKKLFG